MKFIKNIIVIVVLLLSYSSNLIASNNLIDKTDLDTVTSQAKIGTNKYLTFSSTMPFIYKPLELGIGYTHYLKGNKWGISLDYKYVISDRLNYPHDYKHPWKDIMFFEYSYGIYDKIQSINLRASRQFYLGKNSFYSVEAGLSYIIYDELKFVPSFYYTLSNYDYIHERSNFLGLSILTKLYMVDKGAMSVNIFMHNNINPYASYTALGLGITIGNHKKY